MVEHRRKPKRKSRRKNDNKEEQAINGHKKKKKKQCAIFRENIMTKSLFVIIKKKLYKYVEKNYGPHTYFYVKKIEKFIVCDIF